MSTATRVVVLSVALGCGAAAAPAQYPQAQDGFWLGFGLGYGSAGVICDGCNRASRQDGVTGFVKLGGAPSRSLLIGGAINAWGHSDGNATETMANVTASLYLYPRPRSGFFVTGGPRVSHHFLQFGPPLHRAGLGLTARGGEERQKKPLQS